MAGKWEHVGPGGGIADMVLDSFFGPRKETVRHTETGEYREVLVGTGQTVGEAIEKGQFVDKK